MKAVTYHVYGAPEALGLEGVPNPEPKENEILIRIHLARSNQGRLRAAQFSVSSEMVLATFVHSYGTTTT